MNRRGFLKTLSALPALCLPASALAQNDYVGIWPLDGARGAQGSGGSSGGGSGSGSGTGSSGGSGSTTSAGPISILSHNFNFGYVWNALLYGNGVIVAAANSATNGGPDVMYTIDAVNWSSASTGFGGSWDGGVFANGTFYLFSGQGAYAATSTDGQTWQPLVPPFGATNSLPNYAGYFPAYGNGLIVESSAGSSYASMSYSSDGLNWTPANGLPSDVTGVVWQPICYGPPGFVAVTSPAAGGGPGSNLSIGYFSPDGKSWQSFTLPTSAQWQDMAYGNGVYVLVGMVSSTSSSGTPIFTPVVLYSADGVHWSASNYSESLVPACIAFGQGYFVILGHSGGVYAYSSDGINWQSATTTTIPANSTQHQIVSSPFTPFVTINSASPPLVGGAY